MGLAEALETPAADQTSRFVREVAEEIAEHAGDMVKRYTRPAADPSEKDGKEGFRR